MKTIEYDGNGSETYTLLFNQMPQAELLLDEDGAIEITHAINGFVELYNAEADGDVIEIKNDDEKLGVIVDVWNKEQTDCIDTCAFWFDDYKED
jgi:hypothetical protein